MPELLRLRASHGRRYIVEPGVVDDRALLAFTMGQCHAMALALQDATEGTLIGLRQAQLPFDHLLVRIDDGRLVDIGGACSAADVTASGGELLDIDPEAVQALTTDHDWEWPQTDVAALWTAPVLDAVRRGDPHREAICFVHDFALDDLLDVHIEWSRVDTGERLTAFGRRPGDVGGRWVRCAVQSIKEDVDGLRIIDFAPEAFAEHARHFEAVIHAVSQAIVARFREAANPEQPLRPPS